MQPIGLAVQMSYRHTLVAPIALAIGLAGSALADSAPTYAAAPPAHTVRTNIPGVYAYTQPPAGFDPRTASNAELTAWGYPARPSVTEGAEARAHWADEVSPALQRVVPDLVARKGVYHRRALGLKIGSPLPRQNTIAATSGNWSGLALVPASGAQPFSAVAGRWIVPTVKQAPGTCSGGWDYSSQWVGIGGFNDPYLLQAGSAANVFCDIGNNITEYFPWVEWLPQSELVLYKNAASNTLFPFAPGDYIIVTVTATNFSGGVSTTGNLTFADITQGWAASLAFTAASLGGSEVTGQSAEWIVERTEVNGGLATLPDYVADPWWSTTTTDLGGVTHTPGSPGGATAYNITMLDNSNANVSFVDVFGNTALWFFPEGSATK